MAYSDIFAAANDPVFQGRCLVALWKAAQDITTEDAGVSNHQGRADWAASVLRDRVIITPRQVAMQVLRNPTIAASPSSAADGDIQFQVNSVLPSIMVLG